jgi:hypothetical protein
VVEECLLDGDQQMVGEHAEEDVGFGVVLGLMEDRACGERRFHVAEGVLGAGEQGVDAPQFVAREIGAIGLEQIPAVELLGLGVFEIEQAALASALWRFFGRHDITFKKKSLCASERQRQDVVRARRKWTGLSSMSDILT